MPSKRDHYLTMNNDDLRAARVLTLALKFFGSERPIPSSSINADLYPELDADSFRRQYLRDRELLASLGLVIREAGTNGFDQLWQVDGHASYVQGGSLSEEEARTLFVLCHDLISDPAFAYRDELRLALAKIAQMYRGTPLPSAASASPAERKLLATLVHALSEHHAVEVAYTDAQGVSSERTLALYGTFGLRGRTYFVASRLDKHNAAVPDSVRTYRLDRFSSARELPKRSYEIPLDFAVSDYERLPFQMGESLGEAELVLPDEVSRSVARGMSTQGTRVQNGSQSIWRVAYSDLQALAAWCVGECLTARAPQALVEACADVIAQARATDPYDPQLAALEHAPLSRETNKRAGRTGSVTIARQLVALATSLTRQGRVVHASDIATTLGVDYDYARHLIALVSLGSGEAIDYLPVVLGDDDDEVSLMDGARMNVRRVRLTRAETVALSAALAELGVADDDPLFQSLAASYAAPSFSAQDVARTLEAPVSPADASALQTCSSAISAGHGLVFAYTPVSGGATLTRHVVPRLLRHSDTSWYLEAYDLDRQADRVFRIDRIDSLREDETSFAIPTAPQTEDARMVTVRFCDARYVELFPWEELQVLTRENEQVVARLPHFGGTWLARHLAACAGTVQVSDEQLAQEIRAI